MQLTVVCAENQHKKRERHDSVKALMPTQSNATSWTKFMVMSDQKPVEQGDISFNFTSSTWYMISVRALELWDLIVSVFGSVSQISDRTGQPVNDVKKHQKSQGKINAMENIDSVPSNVQSSRQEALLYVFEDNETVIKMIIKGRSLTMRHLHLIGCLIELIWIPKIQIKYIDTKNQLADILTKESFTRDEWNHLLCLFNISHFSSAVCFAVMAKRSQKDSGEERVTAKWRPMMNLIARTPSFVSSLTSVSPGKKYYGNQDPWNPIDKKRKDRGDLITAQIYSKPLIITTMSNSWRASLQQIFKNWITTVLGLLKSGTLRPRRTIDQGNLIKLLGEWYNKFDLITKKFFSTEPRNP